MQETGRVVCGAIANQTNTAPADNKERSLNKPQTLCLDHAFRTKHSSLDPSGRGRAPLDAPGIDVHLPYRPEQGPP